MNNIMRGIRSNITLPSFLDNVWVAINALLMNKLRTLLTTLGICIGIASVIIMVSAGEAVQNYISRQFMSIGPDLVYVLPSGALDLGRGDPQSNGQSASFSSLTMRDVAKLEDPFNMPNVKMVIPELEMMRTTEYGSSQIRGQVVGVPETYFGVVRWNVTSGRLMDEQDSLTSARVAVLGNNLVAKLFPDGVNPIGETIRVGGVPLKVIGVLEKFGGGGGLDTGQNDVVVVPLTTAQSRLQTERNVSGELPLSGIILQATSITSIDDVSSAATKLMRREHKINAFKDDDFTITTTRDLLNSFNAVIGIVTIFLSVIAGISLLVGGIGVMNIMMVTVTERTREIGLRKAVGARYRDIMGQFLTEATVICFIGGAAGLYLALLAMLAVQAAIPALGATVSPRSIVLAVGVTTLIGMFFGLAILLGSIVIGAIHLWRSNQRSSWLSAIVLIIAVVIIIVGIIGVMPTLLAQFGGPVDVAAQGTASPLTVAQPVVLETTMPTNTSTPTVTPTHLPTLTPAPSETEIVLVTPITYTAADTAATTDCSVIAKTMLNLRGDPSVNQQAIGRIFAGSLLPVTGRSADKQWWRVTSNIGNMTVEGWVNVQYVTADKACDDSKVPIIDPTVMPLRTP